MKRIICLASIVALTAISSTPVLANNKPNLQVQIFPLECSLDTIALGNTNTLQVTPENCIPTPPVVVSPPTGGPSPFHLDNTGPVFLDDSLFKIPPSSSDLPHLKTPRIVDPGEVLTEKSADQIQMSTFIVSAVILLIAGFLAAIRAVYIGILTPLIAQGKFPKMRPPWSKK